jgi:hypothetical protein
MNNHETTDIIIYRCQCLIVYKGMSSVIGQPKIMGTCKPVRDIIPTYFAL